MLIYTCEQMRVIEENADVNGLSYVEMMENAGNACAEKIHSTIVGLNSAAKTVAVLCGSGKNGGDGSQRQGLRYPACADERISDGI